MSNNKPIIFALTGKVGSGVWTIYTQLIRYLKATELGLSKAGENISISNFLSKIISGEMLIAFEDKDNNFFGINRSSLVANKIYIVVLEPEQILELSKSDLVQVFPIHIEMPGRGRLEYLLGGEDSNSDTEIINILNQYLIDEKKYCDIDKIMEQLPTLWLYHHNHQDLITKLNKDNFIKLIKSHNEKFNIADLDNFI